MSTVLNTNLSMYSVHVGEIGFESKITRASLTF